MIGSGSFEEGEVDQFVFLDAQRRYNDMAKAYLDAAVRHRRSMLTSNTVVGPANPAVIPEKPVIPKRAKRSDRTALMAVQTTSQCPARS